MNNEALLSYLETGDLLSLAQARPRAPKRRPKRSGGKVAYIGDSLGVGTSPYIRGAKKNVKGGRPSREGVRRYRANTIVFDLGTNDASARDLKRSIRRVKKLNPGANIVMPLVHGPNAKQKNRVIKNSGVRVVRTQKPGGDGIHYSSSGYKRRARAVTRSL